MNTFRNKQFKNELDPSMCFMIVPSCELKSSTEKTLEECVKSCDLGPSSDDLDSQK